MRAHLADWFEQAAARSSDGRARRSFPGGVPPQIPPPSIGDLRDTPFEGDEDPLEALFRESP